MAAAEIENEWKSRYREVLADLETKEREWSELEAALRRAASQLAIAAMGQDAALDGSLDEVLDLVKSSHDSGELTTYAVEKASPTATVLIFHCFLRYRRA